ncbi:hypothetical protein D3C72_1540410 [compost metagenome]
MVLVGVDGQRAHYVSSRGVFKHLTQVGLVLSAYVQLVAQRGKTLGLNCQLLSVPVLKTRAFGIGVRRELKGKTALGGQCTPFLKSRTVGEILQGSLHQRLLARHKSQQ